LFEDLIDQCDLAQTQTFPKKSLANKQIFTNIKKYSRAWLQIQF